MLRKFIRNPQPEQCYVFAEKIKFQEENKIMGESQEHKNQAMEIELMHYSRYVDLNKIFKDSVRNTEVCILSSLFDNEKSFSKRRYFQRYIESLPKTKKSSQNKRKQQKKQKSAQKLAQSITSAVKSFIDKIKKLIHQGDDNFQVEQNIHGLLSQLQIWKLKQQNFNLSSLFQYFQKNENNKNIVFLQVNPQPLLPFSSLLFALYYSLWKIQSSLKITPNQNLFQSNPFLQNGILPRFVILNFSTPPQFDLTIANLLKDNLLYISFPSFSSQFQQQLLRRQIFQSSPCQNIILLPLQMESFSLDSPAKYPSHLYQFALTDSLFHQMTSFMPSTVVMVYDSTHPIQDPHFSRIIRHISTRVNCRIVLYCTDTECRKEQQEGPFADEHDFSKVGYSTRIDTNMDIETQQQKYTTTAQDNIRKVGLFLNHLGKEDEGIRKVDAVEQYKYAQIYPHLNAIANNMQIVFPKVANMFNSPALKIKSELIVSNYRQYSYKLMNCLPQFYTRLFHALERRYGRQASEEYITCTTIKFASRKYSSSINILLNAHPMQITLHNVPQLFQDCQLLYNELPKCNSLHLFILNHVTIQCQPSNFFCSVTTQGGTQKAVMQPLNINPVVEDNVVRCNWHFKQTQKAYVLFWPTHFDHQQHAINQIRSTAYTPFVSSEIFVSTLTNIHFTLVSNAQQYLTPRSVSSVYSFEDQLMIFSATHIHLIDLDVEQCRETTIDHSYYFQEKLHLIQHSNGEVYLFNKNNLQVKQYYKLVFQCTPLHKIIQSTIYISLLPLTKPLLITNKQLSLLKQPKYYQKLMLSNTNNLPPIDCLIHNTIIESKLHLINPSKLRPQPNYIPYGQATGALPKRYILNQLSIQLLQQQRNYIIIKQKDSRYGCRVLQNERQVLNESIVSSACIGDNFYALVRHELHTSGATVLMHAKAKALNPHSVSLRKMYAFLDSHPCHLLPLKGKEIAVMHCPTHSHASDYLLRVSNEEICSEVRMAGKGRVTEGDVLCWFRKENACIVSNALQCLHQNYLWYCQKLVLNDANPVWGKEQAKTILFRRDGQIVKQLSVVKASAIDYKRTLLTVKIDQVLWEGQFDGSSVVEIFSYGTFFETVGIMNCSN